MSCVNEYANPNLKLPSTSCGKGVTFVLFLSMLLTFATVDDIGGLKTRPICPVKI